VAKQYREIKNKKGRGKSNEKERKGMQSRKHVTLTFDLYIQ